MYKKFLLTALALGLAIWVGNIFLHILNAHLNQPRQISPRESLNTTDKKCYDSAQKLLSARRAQLSNDRLQRKNMSAVIIGSTEFNFYKDDKLSLKAGEEKIRQADETIFVPHRRAHVRIPIESLGQIFPGVLTTKAASGTNLVVSVQCQPDRKAIDITEVAYIKKLLDRKEVGLISSDNGRVSQGYERGGAVYPDGLELWFYCASGGLKECESYFMVAPDVLLVIRYPYEQRADWKSIQQALANHFTNAIRG